MVSLRRLRELGDEFNKAAVEHTEAERKYTKAREAFQHARDRATGSVLDKYYSVEEQIEVSNNPLEAEDQQREILESTDESGGRS